MSGLDANGAAVILAVPILALVLVWRWYPKINSLIQKALGNAIEETEPKKTKPTMDSLAARIDILEKELSEAYSDKDNAIKERDKAREEIGQLKSEFQGKIDGLQTQLDDLKKSYEQQTAAVGLVTKERDEINRNYTALLERHNDNLELVNSLTNEMNDLEIKVDALTIDNKAHKSFEVLIDELGTRFASALVPALVNAVQTAIRATNEVKVMPAESKP